MIPVYTDPTDIKVMILSLLSGMTEPVDYPTLHDSICHDDITVNTYDFAQCFEELVELGLIQLVGEEPERVYFITETGFQVAAELQDSLPEELRRRNAIEAARLISLRSTGAVTECTVTEDGPCRFGVHCRIADRRGETLSMTITVQDRTIAEHIRTHFLDKPEGVMRGLLTVLQGDVDFLLG